MFPNHLHDVLGPLSLGHILNTALPYIIKGNNMFICLELKISKVQFNKVLPINNDDPNQCRFFPEPDHRT